MKWFIGGINPEQSAFGRVVGQIENGCESISPRAGEIEPDTLAHGSDGWRTSLEINYYDKLKWNLFALGSYPLGQHQQSA